MRISENMPGWADWLHSDHCILLPGWLMHTQWTLRPDTEACGEWYPFKNLILYHGACKTHKTNISFSFLSLYFFLCLSVSLSLPSHYLSLPDTQVPPSLPERMHRQSGWITSLSALHHQHSPRPAVTVQLCLCDTRASGVNEIHTLKCHFVFKA